MLIIAFWRFDVDHVCLYVLYRVLRDLLGRKDRKATWVLVRRDPRVNLAFRVHLEGLENQVHIHTLEETSQRSVRLV